MVSFEGVLRWILTGALRYGGKMKGLTVPVNHLAQLPQAVAELACF